MSRLYLSKQRAARVEVLARDYPHTVVANAWAGFNRDLHYAFARGSATDLRLL